jgi:hypothetical protein
MADVVLAPAPNIVNQPTGTPRGTLPPSGGEIKLSSMMGRAAAAPAPTATPPAPATAVRPPVTTPPVQVHDDGKKSSEKMFERLRATGKDTNDRTAPKPQTAKAPDALPPATAVAPAEEGDELTATAPAAVLPGSEGAAKPGEAVTPPEVAGEKKKGVNPWHKIKEHEATLKQRDAELADLRQRVQDPEAHKKEFERLSKIEKRNQELEEQIKFVDYSKSAEFTEKYQKPYEESWKRAMAELGDLTIDDGAGRERPMNVNDLMELVNMPIKDAKESAELLFGGMAPEVMAYRKEIKGLFEQQKKALDDAKKSGVEMSAKQTAEQARHMEEMNQMSMREWESYNKSILENPQTGHYFKPVEGDEDLNTRLNKGWAFVDETAKMNLSDPKLTREQRAEAIRRHASVRARAAAFGAMRLRDERHVARIKELEAKLGQYEETVPDFTGRGAAAPPSMVTGNGGMGGLMSRLNKRAK